MTPEKKADYIRAQMWSEGLSDRQATECALIAVAEIISATAAFSETENVFWNEVKNELNKIL
jgi:hypothetical protein